MNVINTNIGSMKATNAANSANKMLGTAMERLSTGKRINSAKDDAAGLAIATSMTSQVRGMNQGIRNANDGISMAQTAEGALGEVTNMLQRMRELAVQAKNDTYSPSDKANLQKEMVALQTQVGSVLSNTEFNGTKLFDGSAGANQDGDVKIQAGANAADTVTLSFGNLNTNDVDGDTNTDDPDAIFSALTIDVTKFETDDGNVFETGTNNEVDWLQMFDDAVSQVSEVRAGLGAAQNQLESAVNSLTSNATNLSDARSRIEDTDYSAETTALAKAQILSQASSAMLAQANQSQQSVLSLLR